MFVFTTVVIGLAMVMLLIRLFAGSTLYDRVLAVNTFGSCTVLLIGVLGLLFGRPDFLDIALLYALINFVGTIAVLKFFRYRRLGDAPEDQAMIDAGTSGEAK
ncbi:MAG: pH regulation protein F [Hyphomicrobiales bacterium]|nr:MAG: pH regulation protein F [Hyphomicrobiales bacterium]